MTADALSPIAGSHDLRLPAWGPYTKRYMGISHVPDVAAGLRFDLSVFAGFYRRSVSIPNVMWESGYHPWEAAPDLSYYRCRHELLWKDQVYCDIDFARLDDHASLVRAECVNNTGEPQQLVLHYMASLHFPPLRIYSRDPIHPFRVSLPPGALWIDALSYSTVHYARFDPRATLSEDGHRRGEVRDHGFVDGQGLGHGWGWSTGDAVTYDVTLPRGVSDAFLLVRYRTWLGGDLKLHLSGITNAEIMLRECRDFAVQVVALGSLPAGTHRLSATSSGGAEIQLDGFAVAPAADVPAVCFEPVAWNPTPEIIAGPRAGSLILKYEQAAPHYGLAWGFAPFQVRQFLCSELDSSMRHMVHEHVQTTLHGHGEGEGHFTNIFMRPIFLAPQARQVIYGMVCDGDQEMVKQHLAEFRAEPEYCEKLHAAARRHAVSMPSTPAGQTYAFSQERMAATVLTNVVYPVRTRGAWIRHNCPGRWWDCLYTWDSGFIGLGLLELDEQRAIDCLNAYMTEPGESDAAFIHHGSPVPTQFYLFQELWNRTRSRDLLAHFYPRLQQYHRFMAGRSGSSTMRTLRSNLLKTWDYFYNSGGWDDYPPQVFVHANGLEASVTPVINTAHAVMTARIMKMAAQALGEPADEYDTDIAMFSEALQMHAYDEESGYFGYVRHSDDGKAAGILRHESGANFDMGLDGAYPLVAGICTSTQEQRLLHYLMNDQRMWCRCGISTVDQSAPYFRNDGYWNGAVWMPHQWLFWRALLDLGRLDDAYRIAGTALDVWKNEVESSYSCFEHFIVQSGRGAGWHHFGGLSSPVLNWYSSYYRPGRLTTGLQAWVQSLEIGAGQRSLTAQLVLSGRERHTPAAIAVLAPGAVLRATWNGQPTAVHERFPGTLEVTLPVGQGHGTLVVG